MERQSHPGRLLVVEGPDGVGKSTICRGLVELLRSRGHDLLPLSFPGKEPGSLGELVYRIHHDQEPLRVAEISVLAKQALHIAAHIDAIDRQILPALAEGKIVLLDRYWWSTWVYGLVSGCRRRKLRSLVNAERSAWGKVRPALAVLLRRPTPIDRDDPPAYWQQLADQYARLAERERLLHPVAVIDNVGQPSATVAMLLESLGTTGASTSRGRSLFGIHGPSKPIQSRAATRILPLKPSVVYDTYWRFAVERQEIFFRRLEGRLSPWTRDQILSVYKFTNVYRASDRVSQYLIRDVIYRDDLPAEPDELFFRIILFKLFNKIETWRTLEATFGTVTFRDYSFEHYDRVLTRAMASGSSIYSAAYIMPTGRRDGGHDRKHRGHLLLLERMLADSIPQQVSECRTMQQAFTLLRAYPGIGDFLAYQYVTDINYSELTDFPESEFVVAGPGALDGIHKCFRDTGGLNDPEIIKFMADRQDQEFERLGLTFRSLWGRQLQLIDCQNIFCEVAKYARVGHPEIDGLTGRSRIKQRFDPKSSLLTPWFPPKWNLNDRIAQWRGTRTEDTDQRP